MSSITIRQGNREKSFPFEEGETLLDIFQRNGIYLSAPCGGNGKCGKCYVFLLKNNIRRPVLSCQTLAADGMIVLWSENSPMKICDDFTLASDGFSSDGSGVGLAVDLGTTTIAAELVDLSTGKGLGVLSETNVQKPFGADVITRCQYTMDHENGLSLLSERVRQQIENMRTSLCIRNKVATPVEVYIAGNTIMQHIFAGLSPASIACAPFTPETLFHQDAPRQSFHYSPCISGYVGGDITAGILSTGLYKTEENCLLIDLDTNGEMALSKGGDIFCCSVASGPAFEGAGITCGCASIAGAINHFKYEDGALRFTTIGEEKPIGICGSGIVELTALLLKLGIIDGSGYLQPPEDLLDTHGLMVEEDADGNGIVYLTEDKKIYFTARDVRQIQLAKAAVMSGIQILLEEAELAESDLNHIYLAGGFGTYIDVVSAAEIGMFPLSLTEKTKSVGNSSLAGIAMACSSSDAKKDLYSIPGKCRYIELSTDARFNDYFTDNMAFSEDN